MIIISALNDLELYRMYYLLWKKLYHYEYAFIIYANSFMDHQIGDELPLSGSPFSVCHTIYVMTQIIRTPAKFSHSMPIRRATINTEPVPCSHNNISYCSTMFAGFISYIACKDLLTSE